jgi:NAD(P)-dependent dehydrogenase (short-subunit alcohol dehydrogenase family)
MKIIVVGATGTIGKRVVKALSGRHEILTVTHSGGDVKVDLAVPDSIRKMYSAIGEFDAVVCAAGVARFGMLDDLTDEDYGIGFKNKLMGQVNLVRFGRERIRDQGSFTLTSGVLSQEPVAGSSAISMVNAAVEAFVRAASLELKRGIRINAVSPIWVSETLKAMGRDGAAGMPAEETAIAYVKSVEGQYNGTILDVRQVG